MFWEVWWYAAMQTESIIPRLKIIHWVFGSCHTRKFGKCDPRKLRLCGQRKYNRENCVSILYSENLVPRKFPHIRYLIMLVYRRLLTTVLTWQSSCVIANYNWKTSKIYLPVIDRGVFHNYFHMCKQLFLCDVIRNHYSWSKPLREFLTFL